MAPKLMLCNCAETMTLDAAKIGAASGLTCSKIHTGLCTHQSGDLAQAMAEGDVVVACQQETPVFEGIADDLGCDTPLAVDIRDRAGWADGAGDATPKIAALLADALLVKPPAKTYDITSLGACLIIGRAQAAFAAADQLSAYLAVTVLLEDATEQPLAGAREIDVLHGRLRSAKGALGNFELGFDALAQTTPVGRGALEFTSPRDGGRSRCDIILDLSGNPPLFPAHQKREGYLRADPGDPLAVGRAVLAASHLTGTFEKPLYIRFEEHLCAHSRAGQTACTRCLDLCPTGAIQPAGEHVAIDPDICAGCGACAAVCPSGAASYDDPPAAHLFERLRTLSDSYISAGGKNLSLLVHDAHGREMISLSARFGRGLPVPSIPLELSELSVFGHTEALVALACGFTQVDILTSPHSEREALGAQIALAEAIAGEPRIALLDISDPDALSDHLFAQTSQAALGGAILPLGGRREATRLAARALRGEAVLELPEGAPYGAVLVDAEACTLCLACASLCPPGALSDDPDNPKLTFKEDACLQCGLCVGVCPENAITLKPQLNLTDAALQEVVLREEEPYPCVECGRPFGVRSTIERIVEKLENNHSMFTNSDNAKLIRMCDDCRIQAQYHSDAQPFAAAPRPRVRTTDDYLDDKET